MEGSVNIRWLYRISDELEKARKKFPIPFASAHEGISVLKEEVDELWDLVKKDGPVDEMKTEAVQVAAMTLRFLEDICSGEL